VNTGFAAGMQGKLVKTTNAGANWTTINLSLTQNFNSVYFLDANTGFICGDGGLILRTTNSGSVWITQNSGTNYALTSISFVNHNTGYMSGKNGTLLKTTTAGLLWSTLVPVTNNDLTSIYFVDSANGYAAGLYGNVLKTTTGGEPIGVRPPSGKVPVEFALYQNYPNPFNPTTTIKFDLPAPRLRQAGIPAAPLSSLAEGTGVSLTIYDILGRGVTTLVNEQLKPGSYEVTWDASNYPSGVYFYQLVTDAFVQAKKMVLIK
jgi:hypothetical protein